MFQGLLVDLIFSFHVRDDSMQFCRSRTAKDAFRVIEAELNFFYDLLYTKAATVHCPSGYIFRAITFGSTVAAFASFYVLNKHGFHEYDVRITYILLLGAIGLECAIYGMIICSDWTIAKIRTSEKHRRSSFQGSIFIEFLLKVKSESSPFALHILSDRENDQKSLLAQTLLPPIAPSSSRSRLSIPLLNASRLPKPKPDSPKTPRSRYSPLKDLSSTWSNRLPKETILLDGCHYEHWFIVMEFPTNRKPFDQKMINTNVKTLVPVVTRIW
ncbi:hypothetical protein NL676_003869 [Syzygium grande]|nr:hypothetical protein NL676_003869 [Syzygium grande]